jgi:hypothetical protein
MISPLAHVTPVQAPAGLLLFLAGVVCGMLMVSLVRRFRAS